MIRHSGLIMTRFTEISIGIMVHVKSLSTRAGSRLTMTCHAVGLGQHTLRQPALLTDDREAPAQVQQLYP
jgi:hypothetical protein